MAGPSLAAPAGRGWAAAQIRPLVYRATLEPLAGHGWQVMLPPAPEAQADMLVV